MTNYIIQYDATSAGDMPNLNENGEVAVASYCDLNYASGWIECIHKYPHLAALGRVVSIAGSTNTIARIIDYEKGNPCYGNPDAIAQWVLRMLAHGVYKPGGYADRSDMPALQDAWVRHHVPRDKTVLWLAAPGADPHPYLDEGFDAVQDAFGPYDVSLVKPDFYPPITPSPHGPLGVFAAHLEVTEGGHWDVHGAPSPTGITRGGPDEWQEVAVGVNRRTGQWRSRPLPIGH